MNTNDAPTMKDVAREAGVSLGTVSKVINGIPVGEHYRKRVEAATKKLGYQVNNYARGLKTNKTYCVALIMPSLRHPFFAVLTNELTNCLMRYGYRSILMITNYDSVAEKNCFTLAQQNKIDGIIALSYSPNLEVDDSIPIVTIDRHFSNSIPCVSSDNYQGGEMAAEKLIELGCRNLLFLRIGPNIYGEVEKRGPGFENACRMAKIRHQSLILSDDDGFQPFCTFLDDHIQEGKLEFDGIFCNSDGLAVRIREFLEGRGIRIPEDVQMIGYDGIVDFATKRYICSTIVQPVSEMAETAVKFLLSGDSALSPANISLPVYFAPGGTTRE
ncbi:MAG: LacI family DNA-binding transcriptional regulator [Faecousia sp.]